jgi:hypothetical protein
MKMIKKPDEKPIRKSEGRLSENIGCNFRQDAGAQSIEKSEALRFFVLLNNQKWK